MRSRLTILHQELIPVWNDWSEVRRETKVGGKTFDVRREVPSNHLIQQLGRALDKWCPEHIIAGVGSDSGLAEAVR